VKNLHLPLIIFFAFTAAPVIAEESDVIHVTQPGDGKMSCQQITDEISAMETVIETSKSSQSKSDMAGIGASIAGHFAGWAGGGIGAAVATNGANAVIGKNKQSAEERMKAAEQRRTMLMGIYAGKGCDDSP
jgi:hypothetical protein